MKRILTALLLSASISPAQAMLIDRGGGFIYDDVQDITWTQDANINGGFHSWNIQVAWADSLSILDTRPGAGGVTYSDWRLPTTLQPDPNCSTQIDPGGGFPLQGADNFCTGSEMGHLFYVDGINANFPGPFTNLQSSSYWSSTEYAPDPSSSAWRFIFGSGVGAQTFAPKFVGIFAWAVRDGDVAAVVPVPAAVWLFGSALGLLGWMRRKAA